MEAIEVRMRCLEAAAKVPAVHVHGQKEGIQEMAETWANWVLASTPATPGTLHLPKKK